MKSKQTTLPEAFCARMRSLLGGDADAFFAAFQEKPFRAFRFDPAKMPPEKVLPLLAGPAPRPVPFEENAYYLACEEVGQTIPHRAGCVYVQDPSAMASVAMLENRRFEAVLDLCAAPGGKSLQIVARHLEEDGFLICNEPDPVRRRALMQNLERCGVSAAVSGFDATVLPGEWEGQFDLVLVDAPCSGEGMMRKNPDAAALWSEKKVAQCAALQERILHSAARAVRPGGLLLYATCTYSPEENEGQIARFLEEYPSFSLLPPPEILAAHAAPGIGIGLCPAGGTLRFYPHVFAGEGQFCALLQKASGESAERKREKQRKPAHAVRGAEEIERIARAFLGEVLTPSFPGKILVRGEDVYLAPARLVAPEICASPGVIVGRVQKGRVVLHHRFFVAMAPYFRNRLSLPLEDARVGKYLAGEEIALAGAPDGWGVVLAENCPLGGVKVTAGTAKNHYPKGLRKESVCTTN